MKPLNHTQSPDDPSPEQVIADFLERYSTPEGIKLLTSILGQVRWSSQELVSTTPLEWPRVDASAHPAHAVRPIYTPLACEEIQKICPDIFSHRDTLSWLHPHIREIFAFLCRDLEEDRETRQIYFAPPFAHLLIARSRLSTITHACVARGLLLSWEEDLTDGLVASSRSLHLEIPDQEDAEFLLWRILRRYFFMLYLYSRCIDDTLLCSIFGEDAQRDLPESMDSLDEEDQDRFYQWVFDAHRHDSEARCICDSYRDQVYRDLHKELKTQRGQLSALLEWLPPQDRSTLSMSVREIDQSLYELSRIHPQHSEDLYSIDGYIALLDHAKSVMGLLDSMSDLSDRCRAIIDGRFVTPVWVPQQYLGKVTARLTSIEGKMHQMISEGGPKSSSAKRVLRDLMQELREIQGSVEQRDDIDTSVRSSICEKIGTLTDRFTELCEASDTALSIHLPASWVESRDSRDLPTRKKRHSLSTQQTDEYRAILRQIADLSLSSTHQNTARVKKSAADGHTSNAVKNIMEYISSHLDDLLDEHGCLSWKTVYEAYSATHEVTSGKRAKVMSAILSWSSSRDHSPQPFYDMIILLPALVRQYATQVWKQMNNKSSVPCHAYLSVLDDFIECLTNTK